MTDLRAQIEALLTPMEHLPARRISDPDDIPRCAVCGILLSPENYHRSLCPVPAVLALIPEGSFLVTRTTPLDVERIMRTMLPAALTPEPTEERHGPYGNEGYCYCGVYVGFSGWPHGAHR
jgi:hypothetical protein